MNKRYDELGQKLDRQQVISLVGGSVGSLSLGSAIPAGFGNMITDHSDRFLVTGALVALGAMSLAKATFAGRKANVIAVEMAAIVSEAKQQPNQG